MRKSGYVILSQEIYYLGFLILLLSCLLILNEDVLLQSFLGINDYLSFFSKLSVCISSLFFIFIIKTSFKDELLKHNFEYVTFILIGVLGSLLLCSSNDLLTAYLAMELQSVAFYLMAAFKKNSNYSIESGLKYFIVGSFASSLFLLGSAIIYGCIGSLNFQDFRLFLYFFSTSTDQSVPEILYVLSSSFFSEFAEDYDSSFSDESYWTRLNILVSTASSLTYYGREGIPFQFPEEFFSDNPQIFGSTDIVIVNYGSEADELLEALVFPLPLIMYYINDYSSYFHETHFLTIASSFSLAHLSIFKISFEYMYGRSPAACSGFNVLDYAFFLPAYSLELLNHLVLPADSLKFSSLSLESFSLLYLGFMLVCLSLFIKLAVAPFHYWSLDVYEGSPNQTTFFFAVVPKIGLFVLLLRICYSGFYELFNDWQFFFLLLSVFSIFIGSLGGLEQRKLKSLMAYSSVSHTGYLLLSFSSNSVEGIQLMIYYIIIFMISGLCFWSIYLFLRQKLKSNYYNKQNKELGDLVLLKLSNPTLALALVTVLFSLAGIPPLVGFLAKFGVFLSILSSSFYIVALFSVLLSVISTFYYIRLIKIISFENDLTGKLYYKISTNKAILISILFFSIIFLCLFPMLIYMMSHKAVMLL